MAELREVRENPVTRQPEVTTYTVWDCLTNIIDKKVNEVALNCLEALVDYFCTWLYTTYNTMYELKMRMREYEQDIAHPERFAIHRLRNNIPLYDFSTTQAASVRHAADGHGRITLTVGGVARRIILSTHPHLDRRFEPAETRAIVILRSGLFFVIEECAHDLTKKRWRVTTSIHSEIPQIAPGEAADLAFPVNNSARELEQQQDAQVFGAALDAIGPEFSQRRKADVMDGVHLFVPDNTDPGKIRFATFSGKLIIDGKFVRNSDYSGFAFPQTNPWGRSFATIRKLEPEGYLISHHGSTRQDFTIASRQDQYTDGFLLNHEESYYVAEPVAADIP